jgi:hypothetical protein
MPPGAVLLCAQTTNNKQRWIIIEVWWPNLPGRLQRKRRCTHPHS